MMLHHHSAVSLLHYSLLLLLLETSLTTGTQYNGGGIARAHHEHKDSHHVPRRKVDGGKGILDDPDLLRDKSHIEEDLSGYLAKDVLAKMSPRELEYHYFRVHDFDKNNRLDGLELLTAVGHVVNHGGEGEGLDLQHLSEVEGMIDEVFTDYDRNSDGMLSFNEYASSRRDVNNAMGTL